MNAQELIQAIRSASVDEIAHIRSLLRIPDAGYGRVEGGDTPRNLGELWNRTEQKLEPIKKNLPAG